MMGGNQYEYQDGGAAPIDLPQRYNSRLVSLIAFRALHDKDIEHFWIGTDVDGVGEFGDICVKFKSKQLNKPVVIFIKTLPNELGHLAFSNFENYYYSHLDIKDKFEDAGGDSLFAGSYNDCECRYILYTTSQCDDTLLPKEARRYCKIDDLLCTNDTTAKIIDNQAEGLDNKLGVTEVVVPGTEVVSDYKDQLHEEPTKGLTITSGECENEEQVIANGMQLAKHFKDLLPFHDKCSVDEFTKNLWLYTKQATTKELENILREEMSQMLDARPLGTFDINADAIYLKYIEDIEDWCTTEDCCPYLTEMSNVYTWTTDEFIENPVLSRAHLWTLRDIDKLQVQFAPNASEPSKFFEERSHVTVIITKGIELSVVKLAHHNKDNVLSFLDLNYILNLSSADSSKLMNEIVNVNDNVYFVLILNKAYGVKSQIMIKDYLQVLYKKKLMVVTNSALVQYVKQLLEPTMSYHIAHDSCSLVDLKQRSRIPVFTRIMFQGAEVGVYNVLPDLESRALICDEVLNKLIINDSTVTIGAPITNTSYEDIKDFYIPRRVVKKQAPSAKSTESGYCGSKHDLNDQPVKLESFYDVNDHVVLLSAKPGMGKSSLVTHLSLNTKAQSPTVWIVRINLSDHSKWFRQWKENNTNIDILETLTYICTVAVNYKEKEKIMLSEINNEIVLSNNFTEMDDHVRFEIRLFLYYFHRRKVIFAFDGFDEICPLYGAVVLKLLKVLINVRPNEHRVWIMSRTYNDIIDSLLPIVGAHYELQGFDDKDQAHCVMRYIRAKWSESKDNTKNRILGFIYYLEQYNRTIHPKFTYILNVCRLVKLYLSYVEDDYIIHKKGERALSPLSLHTIMMDIENAATRNLKTITSDVMLFTRTPHHRFLETTLKTIFFEHKCKMDTNRPNIKAILDRTYQELAEKYKMLAAYATFKEYADQLFTKIEISKIKHLINTIKASEDKVGIVADITNGVPTFTDDIFRQHFAVEYLGDKLLAQEDNGDSKLREFIFNIILYELDDHLLYMFDQTFHDWKRLNDKCNRDIIINLLLAERLGKTSPWKAIEMNLNITTLFLSAFESVNINNIADFVNMVVENGILRVAEVTNNHDVIRAVLDTVVKVDESMLSALLVHNTNESPKEKFDTKKEYSYRLPKFPTSLKASRSNIFRSCDTRFHMPGIKTFPGVYTGPKPP